MTEWWDGFMTGVFVALAPSLFVLAILLIQAPTDDNHQPR